MPCGSRDDDERNIVELQKEAKLATRAACDMAALIRKEDSKMPKNHKGITLFSRLKRETTTWVRTHDAIDASRLKSEARAKQRKETIQKALHKLTEKEKELLNLRYVERDLESESESWESDSSESESDEYKARGKR